MTIPAIWPRGPLGQLMMVPAVASLAVLVLDAARPWVLALDVAVLAIALADLASLRGAARFRVSRVCPETCSLGISQTVRLVLENEGTGRRLRVRDDVAAFFAAEPEFFNLAVPPRSRAELVYRFVPSRRGSYQFDRVDAAVASRLGLWQRLVRWPVPGVIRVYPDLNQIGRYSMLARRDRLSALGLRASRRLGTDNEFERLRDYAEGDDPRHLDWRATARRRKLTVRAYQQNQSQRVVFLIDCGRMMAGDTGDGRSPLDHALNAMLLLAHVALDRGDQVGLLAFSSRIRACVPPVGGVGRLRRLVHAVHDVFPEFVEPRYDRVFVELQRRFRKRSLVVLLTNLVDDLGVEVLADGLGNLSGRHLPLGVFLRDRELFALADRAAAGGTEQSPAKGDDGGRLQDHSAAVGRPTRLDRVGSGDSAASMFRAAAAAELLLDRDRALAGLRRRGVLTLDVFPEELTPELVSRYLELKALHLL